MRLYVSAVLYDTKYFSKAVFAAKVNFLRTSKYFAFIQLYICRFSRSVHDSRGRRGRRPRGHGGRRVRSGLHDRVGAVHEQPDRTHRQRRI